MPLSNKEYSGVGTWYFMECLLFFRIILKIYQTEEASNHLKDTLSGPTDFFEPHFLKYKVYTRQIFNLFLHFVAYLSIFRVSFGKKLIEKLELFKNIRIFALRNI